MAKRRPCIRGSIRNEGNSLRKHAPLRYRRMKNAVLEWHAMSGDRDAHREFLRRLHKRVGSEIKEF